MFAIFAATLSKLGGWASTFGSQTCAVWWVDEPKCPKSLIK